VRGGVSPPEGHDVTADDDLLAEQVHYYCRRAGEYDVTAYWDLAAARARITRIVAALRPTGSVLEIACGTGVRNGALVDAAATVTAIDATPKRSTSRAAGSSAATGTFARVQYSAEGRPDGLE